MASSGAKALKRLLSEDAPVAGAPQRDKKEITSVTIRKAQNGFTVECSGPGMYDEKPHVAKTAEEAVDLAVAKLNGKGYKKAETGENKADEE